MIPHGGAAHQFILRAFAKTGRSPTMEEIRRELKLDGLDQAEALVSELERAGVIHRASGDREITHAYPFSNEPTPHRVQLAGGPQVYAMCAIDALGMPFMLGVNTEIRSKCAHCSEEISVHIESEHITSRDPEEIVVWYARGDDCRVAATDQCPHLNFFCSPKHLQLWKAEHPEQKGDMLTLEHALEGGRRTFGSLLRRSPDVVV